MPIIRGKHSFEENFVQIPNRWLRDNRLSLKSLGLLAQLTTHSIGWKVTIKTLATANNCGQEQIRTAITELEEYGYLERKQQRSEGRFSEAIWVTKDPVAPDSDLPIPGNPITENPIPGNPIHKNTKLKNTMDKNTISKNFDRFWSIYPKKVGVTSAERCFHKLLSGTLSDAEGMAEQIIEGAQRMALDGNLPDKQFIPHGSTWLNRSGWLDEAYPEREVSKEDRSVRDREASDIRRQKEIERSRRELDSMNKTIAPVIECQHGKTLARCVPCSKALVSGK